MWNCRCTLVAAIEGIDDDTARPSRAVPDRAAWERWKQTRGDSDRQAHASGRSVRAFLAQRGVRRQLEARGVSEARARRALADELRAMGYRDGRSFVGLSRQQQQAVWRRAKARLFGPRRPKAEQSELKRFRWVGPKATTFAEKLARVNPHYQDDPAYRNNCQRTVVACELQCRGYDVAARPYAAHDHIGDDGTASWKFGRSHWSLDKDVRFAKNKTHFKTSMSDAFSRWGDGARAVVRVRWQNGGGHFFFARREGGKVVYEDPQTGEARDIDETLRKVSFGRGNAVWFMRVDNREVSDLVGEAVENA